MGKKRLFLLEICLIRLLKVYPEKMTLRYDSVTPYNIDLQATWLLLDTLLIRSKLLAQPLETKTGLDFLKNIEIRDDGVFFGNWALPFSYNLGSLQISLLLIRTVPIKNGLLLD